MSKYTQYGIYYDSRTEQKIMLVERIANGEYWIAEPFPNERPWEEEPYIIVFESELKDVYEARIERAKMKGADDE